MKNLIQISGKDKNRLESLINRRERLIELNQNYHYTQSGNAKIQKYYNCILAVRKEISNIECANIQINKKSTSKAFIGFLNLQNGMTLKTLRTLTVPTV